MTSIKGSKSSISSPHAYHLDGNGVKVRVPVFYHALNSIQCHVMDENKQNIKGKTPLLWFYSIIVFSFCFSSVYMYARSKNENDISWWISVMNLPIAFTWTMLDQSKIFSFKSIWVSTSYPIGCYWSSKFCLHGFYLVNFASIWNLTAMWKIELR